MTKDQIETAIREGIPFEIKMAGGEKYQVPLPTMTGISYLKPNK